MITSGHRRAGRWPCLGRYSCAEAAHDAREACRVVTPIAEPDPG